ncbi:MAG TPA: Gfo/Idh/MocA family oxidoreductase [Pirellulales bacterium]|jgi:predicted dehydrogenase|nr:Gfo/Idh/MocA family oxidoreductase [Pirellulales bacterium]
MTQFGFGIVGTGMIAGVVAEAIGSAKKARLAAVSSRRLANAEGFVAKFPGAAPVEGVAALLARPDVDAVYVATPTMAKEAIALAAIAAGKHVLVDKPFDGRASALRMTEAAAAKGLVFMDATHFVHNPRTAAIQKGLAERIGSPRSLHTCFYFPFDDYHNIRFDPKQEPTGALGDMAWYSMRAVVEYLRPKGKVTSALAVPERHGVTGAVTRVSGLIGFASGEVSTFDVGWTAGTVMQDLQLVGTTGVVGMDDFVLDWTRGFVFRRAEIPAGYTHRTGMATRGEIDFIAAPAEIGQEVAMIDDFADLANHGTPAERKAYADASLKTQEYLDALWATIGS